MRNIDTYIQLKNIIIFDLEINEYTRPRRSRDIPIKAFCVFQKLINQLRKGIRNFLLTFVSSSLNIDKRHSIVDLLLSIFFNVSNEANKKNQLIK